MKKQILFGIIAGIFLALALLNVSAYYSNTLPSHGTRYTFGFDEDFSATNYRYVDYYGRPVYRIYEYNDRNDDGKLSRREKIRAVRFLERSFNNRYAISAGKSSGDAFCQGCKIQSSSATNWGNKPAFNLLATGKDGNYYKPVYDYQQQKFNWRF